MLSPVGGSIYCGHVNDIRNANINCLHVRLPLLIFTVFESQVLQVPRTDISVKSVGDHTATDLID
jgi:hypothetical protein